MLNFATKARSWGHTIRGLSRLLFLDNDPTVYTLTESPVVKRLRSNTRPRTYHEGVRFFTIVVRSVESTFSNGVQGPVSYMNILHWILDKIQDTKDPGTVVEPWTLCPGRVKKPFYWGLITPRAPAISALLQRYLSTASHKEILILRFWQLRTARLHWSAVREASCFG